MSETAVKQQIDDARTWRADDKYVMRDGVQIGSFTTAELAECAVRAVNSHEALVKAAHEAIQTLLDIEHDTDRAGAFLNIRQKLGAALADARGR